MESPFIPRTHQVHAIVKSSGKLRSCGSVRDFWSGAAQPILISILIFQNHFEAISGRVRWAPEQADIKRIHGGHSSVLNFLNFRSFHGMVWV